jgi:homogentisate 1,2-dioxygenase
LFFFFILYFSRPDLGAWTHASQEDTSKPSKIPGTNLAFMFESLYLCKLTAFGAATPKEDNYVDCWKGFPNQFRKLYKPSAQ